MSTSLVSLRWSPAWTALRAALACLALAVSVGCQHWGRAEPAHGADCDCQECLPEDCEACFCFDTHRYSRCFDEHMATYEAAKRAYHSMRQCYAERPNVHVQDGYRQAFVDVALGGKGTVPAVPPERYWSTCYRTAGGHQQAQDWFDGYAAGACDATAHCRYQFNHVASSGVTAFEDNNASANSVIQTQADSQTPWGPEVESSW